MNPFALFANLLKRSDLNPHSGPLPSARPREHAGFCARRPRFACRIAGWLFCWLTLAALGQNPQSIVYSKHNLSVSGPGSLRSSTESDICIFCHAPHNTTGEGPLWNHALSTATYTPYTSSTLKATVGQPTGASKLCLSCHDGTVALGLVANRSSPIPMQSGVTTIPVGRTRIGTDLSAHHPISFIYDSALATKQGELRDPATLVQEVRLDSSGQMQCTSCHDPHNNQYGNFLVMDNTASAMCLNCHTPNQWPTSSHATSMATWPGSGPNPWPHTSGTTVAANACENCHTPHAAGTRRRLLNFSPDEQNCYSCHSGTVAAKNIAADFNKVSAHPIAQTSGIHDPTEDAINAPRHVACEDCHNPHADNNTTALAPMASGALAGVRGVSSGGTVIQRIQNEYELCFRCHADSGNRGPARVSRQFVQTNTRLEFNPANTSYHPVIAVGRNSSVPSLNPPWTTSRFTYCTDCHNNDQGPGAGGNGTKGPHGSSYIPILERQLLLTDFTAYNAGNFALCFKCHSSSVVVSAQGTSWQYHQIHIVTAAAACTTCHDSHASIQPHLINFNTAYVQPCNGVLQYNSLGVNHGNCTLTCHGKNHIAQSY
jgi:predicted CXXCH cytochrome family protein